MNNVEWFDFISEVTDDIITRHTLGGLFLQVSRKAITSFGYPLEEIISQSPYSFIHEDDIAVVKNNHTFLINERKSEWVKYRLKCKNGDYLSLQSYGKLIHSTLDPLGYEIILYTKILDDDDFEKNIGDVFQMTRMSGDDETLSQKYKSQKKRADKSFHHHTLPIPYNTEEEIRILYRAINSSTNGITVADCRQPDMPLMYVNPAFEVMTGYAIEEVVGKNCRFLQGKDTAQPSLEILRRAMLMAEPVVVILRNYKKDGTLFWNKLELAPVRDSEGVLTHYIGIASDISSEVISRNQISELNLMLAETNDQLRIERDREREYAKSLEKINELKDDFVSSVSHEFRTPLASIIGFAQTLLKDNTISEQLREKFLHIIFNDGKRLARIVEDMLDIARIESGKSTLFKETHDIVAIVKDAMSAFTYDKEKNTNPLIFKTNSSIIALECDRDKIIQVLLNLLTNAQKFSPPDEEIIITLAEEEEIVHIKIKDNGIGIHTDDIHHVFEKFYRVKHPGQEIRGTGLGLPIAKNLIELHGGTISVVSTIGHGSEFIVTLPKRVHE
jgi:PAS domain S-box-containing protein